MSEEKNRPTRLKKSTEAYLEQAARFLERGRWHDAIAEMEKAVRVSSDKAPIYRRLAEMYREQRMVDAAVSAARSAIKIRPDDIQTRELLLETLLEIGQFDDAIQESKDLLRVNSRSLLAREVLSIAYLHKGLMEKALQVTNELINLDPTSPVNHFKKAVLYQEKGDIGNAIHEFARVLDMQPDSEMAQDAQQAIDSLDSHQLRHIVMLAVEDYIFRTKLIRDPETAALERGYYLSDSGMATLKQIQFDELPEVYAEWKQRYYH